MIESGPTPGSLTAGRILAGIVGVLCAIYALTVIAAMISAWRFDPIGIGLVAGSGTVAALCAWFALWGHIPESRERLRLTLLGGVLLGGLGFALGFFGPLIFWPGANQGPLLGIFITGPIGFMLGILVGWLYARSRIGAPRDSPTKAAAREGGPR